MTVMWRKYAGYGLLSTYAFCFFTVIFHTVAHAATTTQPHVAKDEPKVLAAQTQASLATEAPTPTMFVSNLVEPETLPPVTPTVLPTATPTPTAKPTETPSTPPPPAPKSSENVGGLDAEKLFAMSNAYRAERGLPALQKDERMCSLAASRAPEINTEIAEGRMHSGLQSRNLPYWNTENIISMSSEDAAFNWWVNDPIHHKAIVGNFTHSCVACSGNACAQEFTSFQAK